MIEVKFTFEEQEYDEAAACVTYSKAYLALHAMSETIRKWIKYEELSEISTELVQEEFYKILENYGLSDKI